MGTEFGTWLVSLGLAWALSNTGAPQKVLRDHYTHLQIQGQVGEDIEWTSAPGPRQPIIVAVLDTGIDSSHPYLQKSIHGKGKNFASPQASAEDTHGHGTHVSGIILQVSDSARILPVKVVQSGPNAPIRPQSSLDHQGEPFPVMETGLSKNVANGIEWALDQGARVINLSLAWPASFRSLEVETALKRAAKEGALVVASAGNDQTNAMVYPCLIDSVICVGSIGPDGKPSHFSNHGDMVDLYAPGLAIVSSWPISRPATQLVGYPGLESRNGTSMAAPFVSGAAAALFSAGYSADQVRERLIRGARPEKKLSLKRAFSYSTPNAASQASHQVSQWIRPSNKGQLYLDWNGVPQTVQISLPFTLHNQEVQSIPHSITLDSKTPTQIPIEKWVHGTRLQYTVHVRHLLAPNPGQKITGFDPRGVIEVRTVEPIQASLLRADFLAISQSGLVQNFNLSGVLARAEGRFKPEAQYLKFFRKENQDLVVFIAHQKTAQTAARIEIQTLHADLSFKSRTEIEPKITQVSEKIRWVGSPESSPCWISIGVSAPLDTPPVDPWKKKNGKVPPEPRLYRVYCVVGGSLRSLVLPSSLTPVEIFPGGQVLLANGDHYRVKYELAPLRISMGSESPLQLGHRQEWTLSPYRQLIGLNRLDSFATSSSPGMTFWGPSTPGALRVTAIQNGTATLDQVLLPQSNLESLVAISGVQFHSNLRTRGIWAQTHYDHLFFPQQFPEPGLPSVGLEPARISLNRYSLIPNLIFSRSFYPTEVRMASGQSEPALYTPALSTNGDQTELVIYDSHQHRLWRPALLKVSAPTCLPIADLVPASVSGQAAPSIAFLCQDRIVLQPLAL